MQDSGKTERKVSQAFQDLFKSIVLKKIWLTIPCWSDDSGYTFKFNKPLKYLQNNSIIHMIRDCTPSTKAQKLYR